MAKQSLDARALDVFVENESESSSAASSKANTNTSLSTAPTPTSISSPSMLDATLRNEDEYPIADPEIKLSVSSLDTLLGPKARSELSEAVAQTRPSVQAVVDHLEALVRAFIETINDRQLSPEHPAVDFFDPKFSANTPPPWPQGVENTTEYLKRLVTLAAETEYRMVIKGLDTHVHKNGHAGVFVTSDVIGVPLGVIRHVVAIFRFRKRDGAWRCFTVEEVIGIQSASDGRPLAGGSPLPF